jgi:cytochrome c oxidase cbb3-type subunit 3
MLNQMKEIIMGNKGFIASGLFILGLSAQSMAQSAEQSLPTEDNTILYILGGIMVLLLLLIIGVGSTLSNLAGNKEFWNSYGKKKDTTVIKSLVIFFIICGIGNDAMALSAEMPDAAEVATNTYGFNFWLLFIVDIILVIILYSMIRILRNMTKVLSGQEEVEEDVLDKLAVSLTNVVPIEQEEEIMMDHEYDGIRELDNVLPPWWVGMFYASIIFALIYFPYYHFGSGQLQAEEYQTEMAEAEAQKAKYMEKMANAVNESNVTLITDNGRLESGKKMYMANCIACHGALGEGSVGPNLTDEYWLHGGGIKNVFKTIKYGVPEKGMIAWQTQMTPAQMNEIASFILTTFPGTNPPNGKEPQGDLYDANAESQKEPEVSDTTAIVETAAVADGMNVEEKDESRE